MKQQKLGKWLNIILLIAMAIVMQGSNYIARKCKTITVCPMCATVVGKSCPCFKVKLCLPVRR
jgi:hypothetical protein